MKERGPSAGQGLPSEEVARRLSIYVVVIGGLLMVLALAATIALGFFWMASLEPVPDGRRVLEVQREGPMAPDAH